VTFPSDGKGPQWSDTASSPGTVLPHWQNSADGLWRFSGKVSNPRLEFHALRIELSCPQLRIVASGGAGSGGDTLSVKVSTFVRDNDLLAGINALPFDPVSDREGEPRTNAGIVVTDGVMISPPHPEFDALVFYNGGFHGSGGAVIVKQSDIRNTGEIANAVGGFRRILENDEPVPRVLDLNTRHPRSAAGISADGKFLFLLVIDGRRQNSIGATEMETALLLKALGAGEGINFDGGGSSALALRYPDGKVRVLNTPIHGGIPGRERAVAGCLGIAYFNAYNEVQP